MPQYFLLTPRLGFRSWSDADLDLAVSLWGDPEVTALFDARGRLTRAQVRERLERELANERAFGVQYWPFFLRETGEFVGCAGLKPYDRARGIWEIGFHLCAAHWGAGYATEAARAVIEHAFATLKPGALVAGHNPRNHASKRVLEKLGFTYVRDELFAGTGLMHPLYELRRLVDRSEAGETGPVAPRVSGMETRDRPVARVLLIDARDRVLLFDTRLTYTHVWMTPGGGVKPGESFETAAHRELWEEVGLADATLGPCIWTVRFRFLFGGVVFDQSERYFPVRVGAIEVRDDNREEAERNEIRGHRWWSLEEIAASVADFRPRDLAGLLFPILRGDDPSEPVPALVERGARIL